MNKLGSALFLIFIGLIVPVILAVRNIQFKQNCSGYLKQAADASSVELAIDRIDRALRYIERKELTHGYTSVLWKTEDENVGYWYHNIKTCRTELENGLKSSQLEQTNLLMKIRESLTDTDETGTILTLPKGITRYPHNALFGLLRFVSCIFLLLGFVRLFGDNY